MLTVISDTYDEMERIVLTAIHTDPDHICRPRGMVIEERLGAHLVLTDPRARLSLSPSRAVNYGFAAGEFCWYLRGAEDLASIVYYNTRMAEFSDDGMTLNSAYGKRIRATGQWANVVDTLAKDPDSRRAVMTIFSPEDVIKAITVGTKDVPCTLSMQFFVRAGRLDLHVTMRSNDAVWGLANDLFSFTLLQEVMLLDLRALEKFKDLELGEYHHNAGSLHLYERHFDLAGVVSVEPPRDKASARMPAIGSKADLVALLADEVAMREGKILGVNAYAGGAAWLFERLLAHRMRRDAEVRWPRLASVPAAA